MAPPPKRFASVRYKSSPQVSRIPFPDDTHLFGLRYEQTLQAEPPIILPPPRNPARLKRIPSVPNSRSSLVIVPPPHQPREQHPAHRTHLKGSPTLDDWKRDSGLAATTSSASVTIHEEDECEGEGEGEGHLLYQKPELEVTRPAIASLSSSSNGPDSQDDVFPRASCQSRWSDSDSSESAPVKTKDASRRLVRSLSLRIAPSSMAKRLRRKTLSEDAVEPTSPVSPVSRGSPAAPSPKIPDSLPGLRQDNTRISSPSTPSPAAREPRPLSQTSLSSSESEFTPINTTIPRGSFVDEDFLTGFTFSKRGSVYFGGKRAVNGSSGSGLAPSPMPMTGAQAAPLAAAHDFNDGASDNGKARRSPKEEAARKMSLPNIRVMSADTQRESQKVRSLYESGDYVNWQDWGPVPRLGEHLEPAEEVPLDEEEKVAKRQSVRAMYLSPTMPQSVSSLPSRQGNSQRREYELAGGIEDWEDVDGADVDRYGFIAVRRPDTRAPIPTAETRSLHSSVGRRKGRNVLSKRIPEQSSPNALARTPSKRVSARSLNTQTSELSTASRLSIRSGIRTATNMLPHNRDRKLVDEAGDMLALPPGLADIEEEEQKNERRAEALKKREAERSEKWRKMAKVTKKGKDGEGMDYEFDTKNPKLIERTWKGIPDRWRSAAWYSFLTASARAAKSEATDEHIVADFHRLQDISSEDDMQIDLDVPRTINRHIMFRRRYRGGQRLLFRVLHAMSIYFPNTGYVQGMAALAASLLCYYDEERCFVMMVRMWQLRGLERLYQPGFAGLMTALSDFEKHWLSRKDVAKKLSEMGIDATAYGTRWYLTLFNLSIPFPAQLRVWDVFMLLGDANAPLESSSSKRKGKGKEQDQEQEQEQEQESPFYGLDIIHSASAALIDALKERLVDADFENVMKMLTSWIQVQDEDHFMKVVRAEWKTHKRT